MDAGCHDIDAPPATDSAMISGVVWMKCPNMSPRPSAPWSRARQAKAQRRQVSTWGETSPAAHLLATTLPPQSSIVNTRSG